MYNAVIFCCDMTLILSYTFNDCRVLHVELLTEGKERVVKGF